VENISHIDREELSHILIEFHGIIKEKNSLKLNHSEMAYLLKIIKKFDKNDGDFVKVNLEKLLRIKFKMSIPECEKMGLTDRIRNNFKKFFNVKTSREKVIIALENSFKDDSLKKMEIYRKIKK